MINLRPNKAIVLKCTKNVGDPSLSITSYGHLDDKCFWDDARLVFSSFWKKNLQCALSDFSKLCTLLSLEILISYIYIPHTIRGVRKGFGESWNLTVCKSARSGSNYAEYFDAYLAKNLVKIGIAWLEMRWGGVGL